LILVEVDVVVPDRFPHLPRLQLHLHHHGPLVVVGIGEYGPSAAGTRVLEDYLDDVRGDAPSMAATAPVRWRRGVPPVRASCPTIPSI
jgi:hypothetical protein